MFEIRLETNDGIICDGSEQVTYHMNTWELELKVIMKSFEIGE